MTVWEWATALDRLCADPADAGAREWAAAEVAAGRGTPGQLRAYQVLSEGEDVLDVLAATPQTVRRLMEGAPESRYAAEAADGGWSAIQVVHHLADNEAVNAVRMRAVLTEDQPDVYGYDSDPWTRFFDVEPWQDALERFAVNRRNTVALARSLAPTDLDRRGVLSYRGAESLRVLLAVLAGHDRDHVDQLAAVLGRTTA